MNDDGIARLFWTLLLGERKDAESIYRAKATAKGITVFESNFAFPCTWTLGDGKATFHLAELEGITLRLSFAVKGKAEDGTPYDYEIILTGGDSIEFTFLTPDSSVELNILSVEYI